MRSKRVGSSRRVSAPSEYGSVATEVMIQLGSGLPYLEKYSDVGFPEFESLHLQNFFCKAQFSKSVASTIPPRPRVLH